MRWPHPPVTLAIVAAYAAVHVLAAIVGPPRFDAGSFAFSPRLALQRRGWHRLFASHFFHLSLFHLLVNASSTLALGSQLERRNGSRWLALTTLGAVAGTSAFHLLLALGWSRLGRALAGRGGAGAAAVLDAKSAGFSGVLFHYVVLEVAESRGGARALFGLASVPDRWYPWALLVAIQIFMPGVSFLGHLSGILSGNLQLLLLASRSSGRSGGGSFLAAAAAGAAAAAVAAARVFPGAHSCRERARSVCAGLSRSIGSARMPRTATAAAGWTWRPRRSSGGEDDDEIEAVRLVDASAAEDDDEEEEEGEEQAFV